MQGIYNYISETNHVSKAYNVAAILGLQFTVQVMLFPVINILYFILLLLLSSSSTTTSYY
jgi:hypothetical protein